MIGQLLAGRSVRWRAFDFATGPRADGTYGRQGPLRERKPAAVVMVEGAYAAGPALADLVDLTVLVDVPVQERHARLREREDAAFLAAWHARWDEVEAYYFREVRPPASFDVVVKG